ncbi:hypothetical protein [Natribacillus halophilus]|uniref:Helix-turn-helix domain-containing protein n=1 Tax=Natribacillus halophilus TaxID=549003 RepID=A0A1G8NSV6_9BACI|nr:hypothetical protein [Natribacillus halophilus]SDI83258.1 hypothetical protein SAMN04488123_10713 [Natribacillus halophilus]
MTATLSNADVSTYQSLSPFTDVDALNHAIRSHLYDHKHELSRGAVAVFKVIARHTIKTVGVAFLKHDTIAGQAGVSMSTVKRSIQALKERSMIDVHRTTRLRGNARGGYGHNVYVIHEPSDERAEMNHREKPQKPSVARPQPVKKAAEALSFEAGSLSDKKCNIRKDVNGSLDSTYVPAHVPNPFVIAAKPFYDVNGIYELWRLVIKAYKRAKMDVDLHDQDLAHTLAQALKGAIFMEKTGRLRGALAGYFYGACMRIFDQMIYEEFLELAAASEDVPGWLLAD